MIIKDAGCIKFVSAIQSIEIIETTENDRPQASQSIAEHPRASQSIADAVAWRCGQPSSITKWLPEIGICIIVAGGFN